MMGISSRKVVEYILDGNDEKALHYLYKKPLKTVIKYVVSNSGTKEDAEDIFQDAVITLFAYIKKGKFNMAYDIEGFLFSVAKNSWINACRKKNIFAKNDYLEFIEDDTDLIGDIIKREKLSYFNKMFELLDDNCKKILTLFIYEKKSMKDIAIILKYKSEGVAKNQHYRCKKYLLKIIDKNPDALKVLKEF